LGGDATAKAITLGNATGATSVTINAGTGGIALSAAGDVSMAPATGTNGTQAITINAQVGRAIFTAQSIAQNASQTYTITNSAVTATSGVFAFATSTTAGSVLGITGTVQASSSLAITVENFGATTATAVIITFWIIS
jgi:hypothetical protein